MDIETVVYTVNTDLRNSITNASLYLDNTIINSNSNSDITASTIRFDNLDSLIIEESNSELRLVLNTTSIGFQKVGETIIGALITDISLQKMEGLESGISSANVIFNNLVSSKSFSIVPATIVASTVSSFGSEAKFRLTMDAGDNTASNSNVSPIVDIQNLVFSTIGSTYTGDYSLNVEDNSANITVSSPVNGILTFDSDNIDELIDMGVITNNETFILTPTGITAGQTVSVKLLGKGITYNVTNVDDSSGLITRSTSDLDLGSQIF